MRALSLHSQSARLFHSHCLYRSSGMRQEFSFFFYNFGFKSLTLVTRNHLFDSLLREVYLPIPYEFPAVHYSIIRHRDSLVAPAKICTGWGLAACFARLTRSSVWRTAAPRTPIPMPV